MIFKNSLSASWPVCELSSPQLDWETDDSAQSTICARARNIH